MSPCSSTTRRRRPGRSRGSSGPPPGPTHRGRRDARTGACTPRATPATPGRPGAIAAGATVLSHVNDSGFWLVSRFFDMDEKTTLKTWTVMETTLGTTAFAISAVLWAVVWTASDLPPDGAKVPTAP
ncbi:MAG: hypothetical protein WKF83_15455 [Nocardioidaceae bacterium]